MKNAEMLRCEECYGEFSNLGSFVTHVLKNHDAIKYYEDHGDELFKDVVVCKECGHQAKNMKGLALHIGHSHNSEAYYNRYLINETSNSGVCAHPDCQNKTTFRGLYFGSDAPYKPGKGYDDYCSIECAHRDPFSKFNTEGHGYYQRSSTAECSAAEILNDCDYHGHAYRRYLPESEYLICKELQNRGVNFVWQKAFGRYNVDIYFPELKLVLELDEPAHACPSMITRDIKRRADILKMHRSDITQWVKIPITTKSLTNDVVDAIMVAIG